jgi:hypothetical protein
MRFLPAEPNNVIHECRCISEAGKWEFGFRRVMFGVRVSLSQIGDDGYTLDYCAAKQRDFALLLFATVLIALEPYPEDVMRSQLQKDFPRFDIKPINRDPCCWKRLQEMANAVIQQRTEEIFNAELK